MKYTFLVIYSLIFLVRISSENTGLNRNNFKERRIFKRQEYNKTISYQIDGPYLTFNGSGRLLRDITTVSLTCSPVCQPSVDGDIPQRVGYGYSREFNEELIRRSTGSIELNLMKFNVLDGQVNGISVVLETKSGNLAGFLVGGYFMNANMNINSNDFIQLTILDEYTIKFEYSIPRFAQCPGTRIRIFNDPETLDQQFDIRYKRTVICNLEKNSDQPGYYKLNLDSSPQQLKLEMFDNQGKVQYQATLDAQIERSAVQTTSQVNIPTNKISSTKLSGHALGGILASTIVAVFGILIGSVNYYFYYRRKILKRKKQRKTINSPDLPIQSLEELKTPEVKYDNIAPQGQGHQEKHELYQGGYLYINDHYIIAENKVSHESQLPSINNDIQTQQVYQSHNMSVNDTNGKAPTMYEGLPPPVPNTPNDTYQAGYMTMNNMVYASPHRPVTNDTQQVYQSHNMSVNDPNVKALTLYEGLPPPVPNTPDDIGQAGYMPLNNAVHESSHPHVTNSTQQVYQSHNMSVNDPNLKAPTMYEGLPPPVSNTPNDTYQAGYMPMNNMVYASPHHLVTNDTQQVYQNNYMHMTDNNMNVDASYMKPF